MSWPSNKIFPLSLSKSFEGLILEVTNTSGATKIDSTLSALTVLDKSIMTDKIKRFLNHKKFSSNE